MLLLYEFYCMFLSIYWNEIRYKEKDQLNERNNKNDDGYDDDNNIALSGVRAILRAKKQEMERNERYFEQKLYSQQ